MYRVRLRFAAITGLETHFFGSICERDLGGSGLAGYRL